MYTNCIVREPCAEMVDGLTTAGLGIPEYRLALEQHTAYQNALEQYGTTVITLPSDDRFPDSVFIEDPALLIREAAILTRPGAISRKGEVDGLKQILSEHFPVLEEIHSPGTLEGGDVLKIEDHYYIGLSDRTNKEGARQLIGILEKYGKSGSTNPLKKYLHLKTGIAYLGNNTLLLAGELKQCSEFQQFKRIEIDDDEEYAANSIMINNIVISPAGYPKTLKNLEFYGYKVIPVDTSEFRKLDGGVSCLSLRF